MPASPVSFKDRLACCITAGAGGAILNELWATWVPAGHPLVRAMVQVGLGETCEVEMGVMVAVPGA